MTVNVTTFAAGSLVGAPVRRVEDPDLLTGRGTYIDNLEIDGMLELAFVRSTVAHARLEGTDTSEARTMPGVVGVWTADDLDVPEYFQFMKLNPVVTRPALAQDRVRFVGDIVAVVAADTRAQAVDAAETVVVDYDPLPAVSDPDAALRPGAPILFDELGSNVVSGNRGAPGDPLEDAEVVVRGRFENQRVAVVPMEGHAIAVVPGDDGLGNEVTLHLTCQMPHMVRMLVAGAVGVDMNKLRVIAPHVGGSFGAKHWNAESLIAARIAGELQRPVRWVETRSENMIAMTHGRAQVQYVELGLKRDGTITGMRCRVIGDAGAYGGFGGTLAMGSTRTMAQAVYHIPKIGFDVVVALTNTTPLGAYRGAGRPEAAALVERILDMAADELGMDPVELRRKNLIQPDEFPYTTVTGVTYDSGDYEAPLREALRVADYDALLAEQAARRERGDSKQLGIGICLYVEVTGGAGGEFSEIEVHDDGTATLKAGTSAHGQGHATAYSAIVSDQLGIPIENIRFVQSDTALVARGGGTGGSRSLQLGGSAVLETAQIVAERAKELAAELLEAAPDDIVIAMDGRVGVTGVPAKALGWGELAVAARDKGEPLLVQHDFSSSGSSFPFGAHVSVVEVDMETGRVVPIRHVAVDDCGTILNPLLVDGQVHGGLASGISQALWEHFVYDDDGNPLTSTLADYAMPSAAEFPSFEASHTETPSPLNPLGAKGIGESATVGSTPAVQNAVVDALSHLGVRHIDMPTTPERVWRAIQDARAGTLRDSWREPPPAFEELPRQDGADTGEQINL
ncbi:MAG TPA: xanthine dehydrogenase family protein molybdopterin-binding subunit [Acidimicrobiia bacterium]|nr:xanthine dehydrogenase family protein molybdopterin-binding subunit [Acidimicrobiia bacterium]